MNDEVCKDALVAARKQATRRPRVRTHTNGGGVRARARRVPKPKRVCILTGGGDAPGLNAVLRAFVKTCDAQGIEVLGSEDGFTGLVEADRLIRMTPRRVRGILPKGGSILGCSNTANPFAYPVKDARGRERLIDVSDIVLRRLRDHAIDILVLVGGDGTMSHAQALAARGVRVIGVEV